MGSPSRPPHRGDQRDRGQIPHAAATGTSWEFELRFPSHDALTEFNEHREDAQINLEVSRVYNPTSGDVGPWFGVTAPSAKRLRSP